MDWPLPRSITGGYLKTMWNKMPESLHEHNKDGFKLLQGTTIRDWWPRSWWNLLRESDHWKTHGWNTWLEEVNILLALHHLGVFWSLPCGFHHNLWCPFCDVCWSTNPKKYTLYKILKYVISIINHTAIGVMTNLAIPFAWGPLHQPRLCWHFCPIP